MAEIKELLPIGSVVLLQGGIRKLMIIGIKQFTEENPGVEYDYSAVLYPEGFLGENTMFLFQHSDINDVIFRGYSNPEREKFIEKAQEIYEEQN